jgi:hypothetical protein
MLEIAHCVSCNISHTRRFGSWLYSRLQAIGFKEDGSKAWLSAEDGSKANFRNIEDNVQHNIGVINQPLEQTFIESSN